ncbi:MAG: penicillin-binding protein, partial [Ligilactobacillus ruminis]|nr:penicillin-binding protein [Ligilactobacillus ruminis]
GQNISLSTKNQIVKEMKKSKITGINFSESTDRMYPNGIFSSHLIGVASKDSSGTLYGTMGLEALYDNYLKGKDGYDMRSTDSYGIKLSGMKSRLVKAKDGDNIYTTFNSRNQSYLESLLNKAQETYHPKSMNVVLMNAKTGAILAASQRPTFNPQTREGIEDQWKNTLMEDTYEPGSVMKILTMSAAINSGNYNENEYFKSGSMKIGNSQRVNDWEVAGWGYLNYRQGFIRSSNVGMAKLEQKMGAKLWEKYIKKFGLLKSTDSGLSSNESSGSIEYKYPIEQANTAFGQGINVTVLQMMQAFSSVANNGEMVKPYLIEKIVNPTSGKTIKTDKKTVVGHPIKKSTAEKVRDMMQDVVNDPNGTGNAYKINGYDIGVKTGTAQISGNNGYLTGETNSIFSVAGMAPIKNPQYVLYVTMKQPAGFGGKTSSEMLATIFNPLMKRVLDESQNESTPSEAIDVKSVVGQETGNAVKSFLDKDLVVTAIGNGAKIIKQSSDAGEELLPGQRIILVTDSGQTLPDLKGWTKSDMFKLKNLLGINVKFKGSGFVENQSVKPGTKIADIKELTVELK